MKDKGRWEGLHLQAASCSDREQEVLLEKVGGALCLLEAKRKKEKVEVLGAKTPIESCPLGRERTSKLAFGGEEVNLGNW